MAGDVGVEWHVPTFSITPKKRKREKENRNSPLYLCSSKFWALAAQPFMGHTP